MKGNFAAAWEELGEENELEDTYSLPFKTLDEAVKNIVMYLGLQPCERSDKVPEGKSSHTLLLSGVFRHVDSIIVKSESKYHPNWTRAGTNILFSSLSMTKLLLSSTSSIPNPTLATNNYLVYSPLTIIMILQGWIRSVGARQAGPV